MRLVIVLAEWAVQHETHFIILPLPLDVESVNEKSETLLIPTVITQLGFNLSKTHVFNYKNNY